MGARQETEFPGNRLSHTVQGVLNMKALRSTHSS